MNNHIEDSSISRNGNTLILAYDHGVEHGPVDFEPEPESSNPENIFKTARHSAVSCLAVQKGIAEQYYEDYSDEVNLLLKLNGSSDLAHREDYYSPKQCTVKYAVEELGADAVGYTMYAGSVHEDKMWEDFRKVQEEARKYDVPVVMWAYPRGRGIEESDYDGQTDPDLIAYAARLGLELGADMVKVKYPGSQEHMENVVRQTGRTKVVMSGGSKRSDEEFLSDVQTTIDAGANGLAVGRNIFQRENPENILDQLEEIIFE